MTDLNQILPGVTKPARYTGGEWNSVVKDWESTPLRVALAYPDLYEIGMSNMALPILYQILNQQPDVLAERVFAPWTDMAAALEQAGIPLFSLESRHPLGDFDVIGFSLGYDLTYTNVLNMLHLARIPVLAAERNGSQPLVIAGGGAALNPEPMADFIDLFVIGEGEEVLLELVTALREGRGQAESKAALLRRLAAIPGIYVPSLYRVDYHTDGTVKSFTPTASEASRTIKRRVVAQLPPPVTDPVVPYIEVVHDRGAIEIQRGCSRGCRFCQAGTMYRPVRERPQDEVIRAVGELINHCGYNEVSLVSLSSSEYTGIDRLIASLLQQYRQHNLSLSLPSLRIDSFSVGLIAALSSRRKLGLTFAPEAGSERLRQVINKNITEAEILETVAAAASRGWNSLKLYFMLGLPTETMDDIEGIINLVAKIRAAGGQGKGKRLQARVSLATFIPKPHTPFQWVAQENEDHLVARHERLQQGLHRLGTRLAWSDPKVSQLEAALSRGDRRIGRVIHRAWQLGATFDAWGECFNHAHWLRAFTECGLDPAFYNRQRPLDERLPWDHIDAGVTPAFLKAEYRRSLEGQSTPDCRYQECSSCGLQRWQASCRQRAVEITDSRR